MYSGKSKNGLTIFVHVMVWILLGFILLFFPPLTWDIKVPNSFWIKQTLNILILACVFYFNALYMAPKFLFLEKRTVFITWFIAIWIFVLLIARIIEINLHVMEEMAALSHDKKLKSTFFPDLYLSIVTLLVLVISTAIAGAQRWQANEKKHEMIEKRQIASELALLKAQINPHFFFNTLNNIYSLTYSDIPLSREAILKLSRMMRYVLYNTLQDKAMLSQEISFINDYIELMKLRLHAQTTLDFNPPVSDHDYSLAPMLLLPFIENAFKHGTSSLEKTRISIDLGVDKGSLSLRVFNHIQNENVSEDLSSGGIGLVNTKRRLDLLYPDRYKLDIEENIEKGTYQVDLQIDLWLINA
ncbi:sensor histidine kinase [Dyadobacter subterraneus]|uniref:Histidine kinase n=1 Tax=Dyadobacter subterraneus TaxID=2773304 RepID=A0ABR9WDD9_9BACT|nr:histidine kinase [Dyadobacter subterraneus]MBE9463497.1 histidine kinase [Dyadobacter subterraneus]